MSERPPLDDASPRRDGGLWEWAVAAYARPGAKDALLTLQESGGADVVLVLWRVWLWEHGRAVTPETEAEALALSAAWRTDVVAPLRAARNALAAPPRASATDGARALRRRILDAELAAERLQLEALERLTAAGGRADCGAQAKLGDCLVAFPPLQHAPVVDIFAVAAALERR